MERKGVMPMPPAMKTYCFFGSLTMKSPSRSETSIESPGLSVLRVFLNVLPRFEVKRVVSITWRS